jgi:predicted RNase H-related nuclease YkuK (DUF458 family)
MSLGGSPITFAEADKEEMKNEVKDFIAAPEARKIEIIKVGTDYEVVFIAENNPPPLAGPGT